MTATAMDYGLGAYARYVPPKSHIDPVAGGKARAATATRDSLGRFQPKQGELQPDPNHGRMGGQVRARSAQRNQLGRFQ